MSTTMEELVGGARIYLRDYPQFFEVDQGPLDTLTIRLPHPLVSPSSLQVYISDPYADPPVPAVLTTAWQLDERNGLLKLTDPTFLGKRLLVSGYHYTWFADSDLAFHMKQVLAEVSYSHAGGLAALSPVHAEVIMLGGVVHALWGLAIELSLDIDVSTPEGMFIPARQRYQQVLQLMQHLETLFTEKSAMLNMGLGGLEQFKLRRVAKLTGRYVPVYVNREFDDPRWPKRVYPPIPDYAAGAASEPITDVIQAWTAASVEANSTVEEIGHGGQDIDWPSIGTRGG